MARLDPVDPVSIQDLQLRLNGCLPIGARGKTVVGMSIGGRTCIVSSGAEIDPGSDSASIEVTLGCTAKLLTSALVRAALEDNAISLDDCLCDVAWAEYREVLSTATVRHMLEHAHGLDDTWIDRVPMRPPEYIDHEALVSLLGRNTRLAGAGQHYSYGNGGPWLAAALVEHLRDQPFCRVAASYLLEKVGAVRGLIATHNPNNKVPAACPATGGSLAMRIDDLLRFLQQQGRICEESSQASGNGSRVLALPGWHATEEGIELGWKKYGSGWIGHNSELYGESTVVRVNPGLRTSIVVFSSSYGATKILHTMFARVFPGIWVFHPVNVRKNSPLSRSEAASVVGTYTSACWRGVIRWDEVAGLRLGIEDSVRGKQPETALRPADRGVFFLLSPVNGRSPYVQVVSSGSLSKRYLWDGAQMLPSE